VRQYFYRDLNPLRPRESPTVTEMTLSEVRKLEGEEVKKEEPKLETIVIRKDLPNYGVVQRCLQAISKADYSGITRADIDLALDSIAGSVAKEEGVDFASAYQATVTGETGKALYSAREEVPVEGTGSPVQKVETISKAEEMERAAESFSKAYNVDLTEARRLVKDYYQNQ
jgi:hypothetical protein